MKIRGIKIARILALVLVISVMPLYAPAYAASLPNDDFITFTNRGSYTLTLKAGDNPTLYCETEDYDSYITVFLESVKSSNNKVVTPSLQYGDSSFEITAKLPGTARLTVEDFDGRISYIDVTVKQGKSTIETAKWVYKNTKKVTVKATNVVKGDKIKLKIGKKTYTKKITKTAQKASVKFKIKKPGFYGKKYNLTLIRKKKVVAKERDYVYLSNNVHVGDTKKKVKWLTSWNDPVKKNKTAYTEQWCYDWDEDGYHDAYLYFRKGRVTDWSIYD